MAERLAARTVPDLTTGCWNFQGCKVGNNGYGQIMRDPKSRKLDYAHRVAWELAHPGQTIPQDQYVLHACDNPRCVNPAHLSLGTQRENIHDACRKGRWTVRKITDNQVEEIRELARRGDLRYREIAALYGIALSTAKHIIAGRCRTVRFDPDHINNVEPVRTVRVPVRGVLHAGDSPSVSAHSSPPLMGRAS